MEDEEPADVGHQHTSYNKELEVASDDHRPGSRDGEVADDDCSAQDDEERVVNDQLPTYIRPKKSKKLGKWVDIWQMTHPLTSISQPSS